MSKKEATPITGMEKVEDQKSQLGALVQFYRAFNTRDMAEMKHNWHQSADIAMDNPLGGIMRGWNEIGPVYERIFSGPARVKVEFHDYTIHSCGEVFYAVGRERGRFEKDGTVIDLRIRTTRIFMTTPDGWKQVHHHGSIENPGLLETYQHAVSGG